MPDATLLFARELTIRQQLNAQTALGLLSLSDEYLLTSLMTICEKTIAEQVSSKLFGIPIHPRKYCINLMYNIKLKM